MTYSCALFSRGATTLEEAQEAKLELVCQKLALSPAAGARHRLRLGSLDSRGDEARSGGAGRHAVRAAGRLRPATRRGAGSRGTGSRSAADYRALADPPFDAIASIGMVEHVGASRIDLYARQGAQLLRPGGRLLNHGIARLRHSDSEAGPFSERYVFPDAAPLHLSRVLAAIELQGLVTDHVEGLAGGLRDDARPLDRPARQPPRGGGAPGRLGAHPGLARLSAGGLPWLPERLHLGVPGACPSPGAVARPLEPAAVPGRTPPGRARRPGSRGRRAVRRSSVVSRRRPAAALGSLRSGT